MKLLRYGDPGAERPGLLGPDGVIRDLSSHINDITGAILNDESLKKLAGLDPQSLPQADGSPRIGPPVTGVQKFVGIGLNFSDHAKEAGLPIPDEPILFTKAVSSISGPNDDVIFPPNAQKPDWEAELAFVIGTKAKHVSVEDGLSHIAGYCVCNDVSERSFQFDSTGDWQKGKSYDSWGPVGPWLVTRDEVPDPQDLDIWLEVNGERMQSGSSRTMIFSVAELVSYISNFMTLHPGDIVTTGTPPGVGLGMKPPRFLRDGDIITVGVTGLGEQRQKVVLKGKEAA